ncbi:DUF3618 domain-containing protein [Herbiconiux sp. L3-i23]|uniref:DUF3618 domain-containing protein n=1 Tax=Herbiconiux sp. L3-i23 TaxID=2905871 RepID=UPI002058682C|nr:DUF3618 domain-containing protein [Herbiconiux sp. L3-i23]BDI21289.1 hypothetical protein L3i23_00650 [Herbiconiux sp. L3-i23]
MTTDDQSLTHKERALGEIRDDIETTREKLAATLDAIEDKLNLPKQAQQAAGKLGDRFRDLQRDNPVVLYASAAIVALGTVGGVLVWRMARR